MHGSRVSRILFLLLASDDRCFMYLQTAADLIVINPCSATPCVCVVQLGASSLPHEEEERVVKASEPLFNVTACANTS